MNWKKVIGIMLAIWPLIGILVLAFIDHGLLDFLKIIAIVLVVLGSMAAGAWLLTDD
jgi:threonine/homoserine efflux transporter RhtA